MSIEELAAVLYNNLPTLRSLRDFEEVDLECIAAAKAVINTIDPVRPHWRAKPEPPEIGFRHRPQDEPGHLPECRLAQPDDPDYPHKDVWFLDCADGCPHLERILEKARGLAAEHGWYR